MHASITSTNPITDGQKELIARLIEDARKKAIRVINPDKPVAQRIIARGNELQDAIIDKMRELSLSPLYIGCFAIGDWWTSYRIGLTPEQVAAIHNFPWSDTVLNAPCSFHKGKMVRETHFAFVGVDSITMMELQRINPKSEEPRFYSYAPDAWYSEQRFATAETLKLRWYLLLKDIVPGSEKKTFDEQSAMLPPEYEVPSAVVETAKDLLVYKKTGIYVNRNRYARTASLASGGSRVIVGPCDAVGIAVSGAWDCYHYDPVGVGASRKFDGTPAA
ncbi:MAG: hypothetical protein ACLQPN_11115 [Bryobacteraceae bacterium]